MNKTLLSVTLGLAVFALTSTHVLASPVSGFSDLNFWGTGSNQSALVIDWNDGSSTQSYAWGFQWSGSTTMANMLTSLANQDSRLFARLDSATAFGPALYGLGYNVGASPFGITGARLPNGNSADPVNFVNGIDDLDTDTGSVQAPSSSTGASAINAGDHYLEGWMDNGFWGSSNGGTSLTLPNSGDWAGNSGIGATSLENNGWYALVFKPGFSGSDSPSVPVSAIPEPGSILLLIAGLGVITWFRRLKR